MPKAEDLKPKSKPNETPSEFSVEKILDRRNISGYTEYFLKWTGYGDDCNTWEPESNLDCPELIAAYEADYLKPALKAKVKMDKPKNIAEDDRPRGFNRGLEVDKIVGATDATGELMFLMMFKGCSEADLVPARQANIRCPQIVLDFYQNKLPWCMKHTQAVR